MKRKRSRRATTRLDDTVTYDTGALLAVEAGDEQMLRTHNEFLARDVTPVVLVVVLAQAWRGGPQPLLSRLLSRARIEPYYEDDARQTGAALRASGTHDIVDAAVVVSALERGDEVVTGDPDDLLLIADALGRPLTVRRPKRHTLSLAAA